MPALTLDARQQTSFGGAVVAGVIVAGVFGQDYPAYLCIAVPALAAAFLWVRSGGLGMPVMPIISGLFFLYYAVPLLRHEVTAYDSDEILEAAITVGSFLVAASLAAQLFYVKMHRRSVNYGRDFISYPRLILVAFAGLASGIIYHLMLISGRLDWLGSSIGVVRAVALTTASISCYLIGYARASRLLTGGVWLLALSAMLTLIVLALSNLLLVGGLMICLASLLGYSITAKRLPWISLGLVFAILAVLHAGKYEMRRLYWATELEAARQISVFQVPGIMVDWFDAGLEALWSGQQESDVLERASLLHMVLLVQQATPDFIPYLQGETYALLPSMLVPRFVDEEKAISQAGLNLLSVRYGVQTAEATASTTIAWGLVAEAWANFGALGVIVAGAVFGTLCGAVTRFGIGASAISLRMFVTVAATLVLLDVEADFSYLLVTLAQAIVAALILGGLLRFMGNRRPSTTDPRHAVLRAGRSSLSEISSAD